MKAKNPSLVVLVPLHPIFIGGGRMLNRVPVDIKHRKASKRHGGVHRTDTPISVHIVTGKLDAMFINHMGEVKLKFTKGALDVGYELPGTVRM